MHKQCDSSIIQGYKTKQINKACNGTFCGLGGMTSSVNFSSSQFFLKEISNKVK